MYDTRAIQLDHEKLDAYRCAIEFLRVALAILAKLPRGEAELRSQLRRAAMSIPLNIAEGTGKTSPADRARFYLTSEQAESGRPLLVRLAAMLSKMSRPPTPES